MKSAIERPLGTWLSLTCQGHLIINEQPFAIHETRENGRNLRLILTHEGIFYTFVLPQTLARKLIDTGCNEIISEIDPIRTIQN